MRRLTLSALSLLGSGCVASTVGLLELQDAESDAEVEAAVAQAGRILVSAERPLALRLTAAKVLGRLGSPEAVPGLAVVLESKGEPETLRGHAAWALGELRDPRAVTPLLAALKTPLGPMAGERVLEALAKHAPLLLGDHDRLLALAEAMVFFAGQQAEAPPPVYDLISARTRTLSVSREVLAHAAERARSGGDAADQAALYQAAFELLGRLEGSRAEIIAGGEGWKARVEAALGACRQALDGGDPRVVRLIVWYLGRLGDLPEIGGPAGEVLVGARGEAVSRPTLDREAALRLISAWALTRLELSSIGARRALIWDVLSKEVNGAVLSVLADQAPVGQEQDNLQKLLDVEVKVSAP